MVFINLYCPFISRFIKPYCKNIKLYYYWTSDIYGSLPPL